MTQSDHEANDQEIELRAISLWNKQHPDRPWRRAGSLHRYHKSSHALHGIPAFPEEQAQFRFLAAHAMTVAQDRTCF